MQGFDITPDLRRMCSSLTLQQIYKLTEHHHDDWITGSQTTDTIVLLQTLKRVVDSTVRLRSPLCFLSMDISYTMHSYMIFAGLYIAFITLSHRL